MGVGSGVGVGVGSGGAGEGGAVSVVDGEGDSPSAYENAGRISASISIIAKNRFMFTPLAWS